MAGSWGEVKLGAHSGPQVKDWVVNPRERLLGTIRGGKVDRVPLLLHDFHYASPEDVEEAAKRPIVERMLDETHFLVSFPAFINRYLVTPPQRIREVSREERNGETTTVSEIDTPKGPLTAVTGTNRVSRTTWTLKYPVESLEDIEKIRSVPWEMPPDLRPPDLTNVPAAFETRGVAHTGVSSPFVCVAGMMPYEFFLGLCNTHLGLLEELTAQCLERILEVLEVLLSTRVIDLVWMGGCEWLTPPMGAMAHYEALVQRFETPIIERIHAAGALSHVHCHGNVRSTLEMVRARCADYFEPVEPPPDGDITFAEAKALANGGMTLGGNIESRILVHGDAATVERAARCAFEGGKERMALQTSEGPLQPLTPGMSANYHTLIDVWEELSAIP